MPRYWIGWSALVESEDREAARLAEISACNGIGKVIADVLDADESVVLDVIPSEEVEEEFDSDA